MDLWTALRVVARHWLVLMVGLALTGAVLVAVYLGLPRQYSSTGTVVVLQPSGISNPLSSFSSSSQLAASVVLTLASSEASAAEVRARGGAADYSLAVDPNLPTITITATSPNPAMALHTVGVVSQAMNDVLAQSQTHLGVPRSTWLRVVPLENPTTAANTGGKNKVLAIAAALGALVAVSLTFVAESIAVFRRRTRGLPTLDVAPAASDFERWDSDAVGPRQQAPRAAATPSPTPTATPTPTPTPTPGDNVKAAAAEAPVLAGKLDLAGKTDSKTIQAMADAAGNSYATELLLVQHNPSLISAWLEQQDNADSTKTLQPAKWVVPSASQSVDEVANEARRPLCSEPLDGTEPNGLVGG
jgi:hypothetical protein